MGRKRVQVTMTKELLEQFESFQKRFPSLPESQLAAMLISYGIAAWGKNNE